MHTNDIIQACSMLANMGRKPTVALVKTKLEGKVPLALIVQGIKLYQAQTLQDTSNAIEPEQPIDLDKVSPSPAKCNCEQRVSSLEHQIVLMGGAIKELQAQVKALTER